MKRIRVAVSAAMVVAMVSLQPAPAMAQRDRRDRQEDRRDRQEDRRDRREDRRDRYEDRWDRYEDRWDRYDDRRDRYYDAARYYRHDNRYKTRRLNRYDRIYRGSDNRYYCKRDDGTTGLIVGAMAGGVLGQVIAPGGSKTVGAILGAGAGALIGRAIDDGDMVCR